MQRLSLSLFLSCLFLPLPLSSSFLSSFLSCAAFSFCTRWSSNSTWVVENEILLLSCNSAMNWVMVFCMNMGWLSVEVMLIGAISSVERSFLSSMEVIFYRRCPWCHWTVSNWGWIKLSDGELSPSSELQAARNAWRYCSGNDDCVPWWSYLAG